jgi:hypothetical protein
MMDLDPVNANTHLTAHRARVARAERTGLLRSAGEVSAAPRRPSILAVPLVRRLLRAIGAVLDRAGDLPYDSREALRSDEQMLAALGIRWETDAAYDCTLADETRAARLRHLSARAVVAPVSSMPLTAAGAVSPPNRPPLAA